MGLAQPGDKFLVNRNDQAQVLLQENLMAEIQDTDYMLVNRGDVTHKITGADVIDSFVPDLYINRVNLSKYNPLTEETISSTIDAGGGMPPYTQSRVWGYRVSSNDPDIDTAATGPSFYVGAAYVQMQLYCRATLTDSRGTSVTLQSDYTEPVVLSNAPPAGGTVTLTKETTGARFTNQDFKIEASFTINGVPASKKYLTAWVDGNFFSPLDLAPITEYVEEDLVNRFTTNRPQGLISPDAAFADIEYNPRIDYAYAMNGTRAHTGLPASSDANKLYYIQWDPPEPIDYSNTNIYGNTVNGVTRYNEQMYTSWTAGYFDTVDSDDRGIITMNVLISDDLSGQGNYRLLSDLPLYTIQGPSSIALARYGMEDGLPPQGKVYSIRWEQRMITYDGRAPMAPGIYIAFIQSRQNVPWALPSYQGSTGWSYAASDFKPTLKFQDSRNFDKLSIGDSIQENGGTGYGEVVEIDSANSTLRLNRMGPWTYVQPEPGDPKMQYESASYDPGYFWTPHANHTWQVGNTVSTMPKADPSARQYIIFDGDDVIDLTKDVIAPVDMATTEANPTFNLNFPATFPSGQAPDDELLDGTQLTVAVYAENNVGSTAAAEASLVPGTTLFTDLSDAEKRAMKLQQSTYEIRRDAQQKAAIIQDLLNQGFTQAEIDAAIA